VQVRLDGQLVGLQQIFARFYDSNAEARTRMRSAITRAQLRGKNVYSVEENQSKVEVATQHAMATPTELAAGEALVVSTRCPSRFKYWSSNTPSTFGALMGLVYHVKSGLLLVADAALSRILLVQAFHEPCNVATLLCGGPSPSKQQVVRPTDLVLVGATLYITDPGHDPPCVWRLDVSGALKRGGFSKACAQSEGGVDDDKSSGRGPSSKPALQVLELQTGARWGSPFGIDADADSGTLYVSDRSARNIVRLTPTSDIHVALPLWSSMPTEPMGVAFHAELLFVAAGDTVYLLSTNASGCGIPVLSIDSARFIGVVIAPPALGSALYTIDATRNALMRLCVWGDAFCARAAETLVGGNTLRPEGCVWGEGTASDVKLWGPTFCTFAANTLFLSNSGDGPFGKLLQLTNVVPLVTRLMPAIRDLGNACCATLTPNDHARSWMHALLLLQRTRDFLDAVESENMVYTGQKGLEGPGGNFSNSLRLNVRSNVIALSACLSHLAALGVPLEVMESLSPTVLNTNANERFNGRQRRHSPNADAYEWVCLRALTIEDESSLMLGNGGFSDWSGERRSRQGYCEVLGALGVPATYKLKKPDQRASSQRRVRPSDGDLAILREFCREFQRVRCQRVTDHGKEKMGTKPSVYFTPAVVDPELNQDAESMLTRLLARTLSCADSVGAGSFRAGQESHTLLPERSLVYIKPAGHSSAVWVAELVDGLFVLISRTSSAEEPPTVTMSSQQLRIRYFCLDEEATATCNGMHFVFEKEHTLSTWEAIWDVARGFVHRELSADGLLTAFRISTGALRCESNL
jgi:hypothetical protein